ncbi:hypothetical protein N7475_003697 [Penicillium sp. IBT 31633x]|nr:hypothetical protein N7475_003697 [Penicillium sp. IBT 31633x]
MVYYGFILSDDKSDTSLGYSEVFSDHASDTNSSTEPSVFGLGSESKDKSEDKLVSEEEEEQLPLEYYLYEAESLDIS